MDRFELRLNGGTYTVWWRTLLVVLIWSAVCWPLVAAAAESEHRLTILHTNDLLGRLLPEPYFDEADWGGFARLAYLIAEQRSTRADSVLIVDGGDALGDSPLAGVDAGRMVVRLMNAMGYDAMAVGNHEFDYGLDSLRIRASEANFNVLSANVRVAADSTALFAPFVLVERAGLQIALIGLLSPQALKVINPVKNPALNIDDPHLVLKTLLEGPAGQADLQVILVHMSAQEARDLVRTFPQVDLCIAGGFGRETRRGAGEHVVRFAGGGYLVTTPGWGAFLGQVEMTVRREEDKVVLVDVQPRLVPISPEVLQDQTVASLIDEQQETAQRAQQQQLGNTKEPIEDAAQWVADLIRTRLKTEVSVINQGTLRSLTLDGDIQLGTLANLVRYDDVLVRVEVLGSQLKAMADSSAKRTSGSQRLVFSGYDVQASLIGGRPLVPEEKYQVATTSYLASGGDDYWTKKEAPNMESADWITLKQMLKEHIRRYPNLGRWDGVRRGGQSVWKNSTKLNGSLSHTTLDASAGRYSGVSFLGGHDALAWNGQFESRTSYLSQRGTLVALLRSGFGQLRARSSLREAVDRLEGDVLYTWSQRQFAPFLGLDINTVWTAASGEKHPLALRFKGGLHKKWGPDTGVRVGLAVEKDYVQATNVMGLEIAPEYKEELWPGNIVSSQAKFFWGVRQRSTLSLQNFNSLRIRLLGNLAATLDANFFLHRDSQVQALAVKSELQVGLGYAWSEKWL